jgi:predicted  nucleic acid-binding Zn-ribbon protein
MNEKDYTIKLLELIVSEQKETNIKVTKLDDKLCDLDKSINNDIKHIVADISALRVSNEFINREIVKQCEKDKSTDKEISLVSKEVSDVREKGATNKTSFDMFMVFFKVAI